MDLPPAPTPPANSTGASTNNVDRTANLLNLLKFSSSGGSTSSHQAQPPQEQQQQQQLQQLQQLQQENDRSSFGQYAARIHQPAPAGADPTGLLAALMRGGHEPDESRPQPPAANNAFAAASPSSDTRSYLLNLLNRPKPSQTDQPLVADASRSEAQSVDAAGDTSRYQGHYQQQQSNNYQAAQQYQSPAQHQTRSDSFSDVPHPASNVSSFSFAPTTQESSADMSALYQQVIGSLQKPSPRDQGHSGAPSLRVQSKDHSSPATSTRPEPRPGSERSLVASPPEHGRRVADRSSSLQSHRSTQQTVKQTPPSSEFDNISIAEKNKEGLASDVVGARSDSARPAERQAELAPPKNGSASPQLPASRDAQEWTDDETAAPGEGPATDRNDKMSTDGASHSTSVEPAAASAQAVADSWESADHEEIVVIEEKEPAPVRVYNFPMKPWISITLQEGRTDPRPEFREESIMDIARLKKDFDQLDRNLYTASQTYMTYGMSKQGGLRVIRQDDGKDAKVFTDTKDRIFNVSMLVNPPDGFAGVHREAIIGTGVSGTVYWVQVKDGEKDHIEDAHLEQYGFALPAVTVDDGGAYGVQKTRARASTMHSECFAVGRGKYINFIWPSYVMQNNLFKTGHDRVVETERLFKQCSLRINTAKACKDFAFSQDDTVIVSVDNAGRVKFWDVRDLTAIKEGSDPQAPMPAHTSLEVKEPLLTLACAPEGEKAWPTSVLFVDKQRPFQRRSALRYMMVGMKQNHTLQLWDLALGRPVQEFNLPHSSESDAMCSILYHPASGMIVIGHPTRNSIYFAHLSAPKYSVKGMSQADYIQRLVAQDSSIPQPDSTAVISGVREYSFANRGIIRSLDILANPAMVQDADEPTLFELYAMHSKGVACLLIRQSELGWSKDNKVLDAVDAVAESVVAVSRIKTPQPPEPGADQGPSRPSKGKEVLSEAPLTGWATVPDQDETPPFAFKTDEAKDAETPIQPPKEGQSKKANDPKHSRMKKAQSTEHQAATGSRTEVAEPPVVASGSSNKTMALPDSLDSVVADLESRMKTTMTDTLHSALKKLESDMEEGARARDESFHRHQLKLLNMVSEVLNENTQKVLESLIHHKFTELVIPAIGDHAGRAVNDHLQHTLRPAVDSSVRDEMQRALPRALRSGDFIKAVSDQLGAVVASEVLVGLTATVSKVATQTAQRVAHELQQKQQEQMKVLEAQHAADAGKMDQLMVQVGRLTDMVSTVAASQSSLQAELSKLKQQQPVHELPAASSHGGSGFMGRPGYGTSMLSGAASQHGSLAASQHGPQQQQQQQGYQASPHHYMRGVPSSHAAVSSIGGGGGRDASEHASSVSGRVAAEAEYQLVERMQRIEKLIQDGRLQEAVVQWIQSGQENDIFRRCLGGYAPSTFEGLPPLLLLVVIATISKELKPNQLLKQEVDWIEMAVRAFADNLPSYDWEGQDWEKVMNSASQTLQLLITRLKPMIASYTDGFPSNPFLANVEKGKMEWVVRSSEHILASFRGAHSYR
ncbi:WD40 repeat-like-containing domain [Ophiocordyceps camponoti-floridani]|uniref:WD40 repeat-like-containing domain n=1 Tax=Ophiocordyceps camponoti-floridani TaxID=2030778 RepID=A0A8H4Q8S4_9HYPO|nr:WD40 repeat-like-containing domain [Ophiocordyceps camponoti-floridani]